MQKMLESAISLMKKTNMHMKFSASADPLCALTVSQSDNWTWLAFTFTYRIKDFLQTATFLDVAVSRLCSSFSQVKY